MSQRLDKWLCYARFVKHRSLAQELIESGHIRVNRVKIQKPAHAIKPQDVLTIAIHNQIRVVRVLGEAERRGPATEARLLYEDLMPDPLKPQTDENMGA
ncbi:MAG: RNA-binding S4 domain-containing protein [Alphaproteobacteria bacterium]|nr:RNA-binding S4 domain-containing protein [Alphaproteobacteria bacterium]